MKDTAKEKLPTGKEIIARFVEVTGTPAAREKITNRVTTVSFKNESMGLDGKAVSKVGPGGKLVFLMDLGPMGKVIRWSDGKVAATFEPQSEPRMLEGDELLDALRTAQLFPELTPEAFFKTIETVGQETLEGQECYKVDTVAPGGEKRSWYYSKASGLLVRMISIKKRGPAEATTELVLSDWKEVDGVKLAHTQTQLTVVNGLSIETVIHTEKLEHNVKLNDADFAVPAELKEVVAASGMAVAQPAAVAAIKGVEPAEPKPTSPSPSPSPSSSPAAAAAPTAGEKLPTGKEVLAKFLDATGTAKAREAIKNRVFTGTFINEAMGLDGKVLSKVGGDGKMLLTVELGALGKVVRWFDGTMGAMQQPQAEAKMLTGEDLLDAQRDASLFWELTPDAFFKTIENKGIEKVEGQDCYKLETTTTGGGKRTWYYSKASGLLVKWAAVKQRGPMEVAIEMVLSDWKEFDGIKIACSQSQSMTIGTNILESVIRTETVQHNAKLNAADFAVPEELEEVVAAAKKAPTTAEGKPAAAATTTAKPKADDK